MQICAAVKFQHTLFKIIFFFLKKGFLITLREDIYIYIYISTNMDKGQTLNGVRRNFILFILFFIILKGF